MAPLGRVRRPGGGRKKLTERDPALLPALLALVEPTQRGDPMSPLRWTTKSTRVLADELTRLGHVIGPDTVAQLLRGEGFSLQGNAKSLEGMQHPDRDAQFRYLAGQVQEHPDAGAPVVSMDAKKKELVGQFKNAGRTWTRTGEPVRVGLLRLPRQRGRQSAAVRDLRYGGEHRLGERRHRPRHRPRRGGIPAPLVERGGPRRSLSAAPPGC